MLKKFYIFFLNVSIFISLLSQQNSEELYRIYLRDKKSNKNSISKPHLFLSEKALERRKKNNVSITHEDLPVSEIYIDSIIASGGHILHTSRWLNTVLVSINTNQSVKKISQLSFVKNIVRVRDSLYLHDKKLRDDKFLITCNPSILHFSEHIFQLKLNCGDYLHKKGYTGKNIRIAIIDAGFKEITNFFTLQHLVNQGRILEIKDFVYPTADILQIHNHGSIVLSVMASVDNGLNIGSAPDAEYYLFRSEDVLAEYPAEEDFWVAAAEYADSLGVDIINTSLGYTTFDNIEYNYRYIDMDGNTTFIARAAQIAASKGILVVVSAGNDGNKSWKYIGTPADAKGIIAVGSINSLNNRSTFSSIGPSADGRIKPEVMALGENVLAEISPQNLTNVKGTSFAAPIISGLAACLMQAFPATDLATLRSAIIVSGNQYNYPDFYSGYGIANFEKAYLWLLQSKNFYPNIQLYPNPCHNKLIIKWLNPDKEKIKLICFNMKGQICFIVFSDHYQYIDLSKNISELPPNLYLLSVQFKNYIFTYKLIKT